MKPKMTLPQFISTWDSEDGEISESWEKHWIENLPKFLSKEITEKHQGDCTRESFPCMLCMLENFLREYREYYFEGENRMKEGSTKPAPTKVDTLATMLDIPCDILREALKEVYEQMKQEEADDGK